MRTVVRLLGLLFVLAALFVLGADLADADAGEGRGLMPLGQLWYELHSGSLNLTQAVIERYIWQPLWDPVVITVLQWPAAAVFGVLGAILLALGFVPRRAHEAESGDAQPADPNDAETTPPPA